MSSIILLEGDYTNSYVPSNINGIESVAEREKESDLYPVKITNRGKNLLDLSTFTPVLDPVTKASINGNIITVRGLTLGSVEAYTNVNAIKLKVYLEEGKTYSFSFKSDAQFGGTVGTDTVEIFFMLEGTLKNYFNVLGQRTVTIPAGCSGDYYVRFDVNSGNKTHTFYDIQVEEGDAVTDYEPYHEPTLTEIPLPQPLRSLPNGIKDTIEGNKLVQRIDKIILDGSRNYTRHSNLSFNDMSLFYFINANVNKTSHIGISSKLPCYDVTERTKCLNNQEECIILSDGSTGLVQIILKNTSLATQDVDGLKAYLRANPMTLYYELETPIEHTINKPPISISKGINMVSTNNNIKPELACKYKQSKKIIKYLYNLGDTCNSITGGYDTEDYFKYGGNAQPIFNSNNIYIKTDNTNRSCILQTNNSFNLSNYGKLCVDIEVINPMYINGPSESSQDWSWLVIGTYSHKIDTDIMDSFTLKQFKLNETKTRQVLKFDISDVNNSGHIAIWSTSSSQATRITDIKIYRIWLEKKEPTILYSNILYSNGNENTSLTGGYLTSSNNSATCNIEKQADNLYVNCTGKQSFDSMCYARTNKTIKPCKIKVSVKNNYISAKGVAFCMFLSEKETISTVNEFNSIKNKKYIKASNTTLGQYIDLEMDLTDNTEGYFYVFCMVAGSADYTCKVNIRKIEITKANKFLNNYYGYLLIAGLCNTTGIALTTNTANVFVSDVIDTIGNTLEPFVSYRECNNNYYLRLDDIVISKFIDFANSNKSKYDINLNFTSLNEYKAHYGSGRPTDIVVPGSEQDIDWKTNSNIYIPNGQPASNYECNIIKRLYDNGDEVVSDTGGWTAGNNSTIDSGSVTKYSDKIYFNCLTNGIENKVMFLACNNMIDTSKYSCLKVKAQVTEMPNSTYKPSLGFGLVTEKFDIGKWNILYEIMRMDSEPTVYELPISSKNAGYIEISGYIANGYFYEVWLLM